MRRILLCSVLVTLALGGAALAAGPVAKVTVTPNQAGRGSTATADVNPPRASANPRVITLKVQRGAKVDPRARAVKCTKAQATSDNCPAKSRIGGGSNDVTVTSQVFGTSHVKVPVDLYLMPPLQQGDVAGVAAHFTVTETGQEGHSLGRVTKIATGKYGLQVRFDKLDTAIKPPSGFTAHVDHVHLSYGAHRTVQKNGSSVTYNLFTNPKTCTGSWAFQVRLGYATGNPVVFNGSTPCTP